LEVNLPWEVSVLRVETRAEKVALAAKAQTMENPRRQQKRNKRENNLVGVA
jgi:hypothetical protein